MTNHPMKKDCLMTKLERSDTCGKPFRLETQYVSHFVLRNSFVIGFFVIRHSPSSPRR